MIPLLLITNRHQSIVKFIDKIKEKNNLIFEIEPTEKEFSINQIRELIRETSKYFKNRRIYVLENFHLSSLEAQNSFLKLLEEPPSNVLFVITSDNENKLIPTIRSRTKIIFLEKKKHIELDPKLKEVLNSFLTTKHFKIPMEQITLNDIIIFFRERLKSDKNASVIIKEAIRLKTLLENNNLNPLLTLDHMLIFIKKQYTIK